MGDLEEYAKRIEEQRNTRLKDHKAAARRDKRAEARKAAEKARGGAEGTARGVRAPPRPTAGKEVVVRAGKGPAGAVVEEAAEKLPSSS